MKAIYDFGITQDDPQVEEYGFQLEDSNLLCFASAGDFPLSVLSKYNTKIMALDVSENQIRLCRLKLLAATNLEPNEAAQLIGFQKSTSQQRKAYFEIIAWQMDKSAVDFWNKVTLGWRNDPISLSRFEHYLGLFCRLAKNYMGEKKLRHYGNMNDVKEQATYFETHFRTLFIKYFFKIVFSPRLYKRRGLNAQGLIHLKEDLPQKFYNKFKAFFTATPAKSNFYLHYYLFGNITNEDAFPDYLKEKHRTTLVNNADHIQFCVQPIQEYLSIAQTLKFKNIALSNISDWLDEVAMHNVLLDIRQKSEGHTALMMRYIHKNPLTEDNAQLLSKVDEAFSHEVSTIDRFPFYSIIKAEMEPS